MNKVSIIIPTYNCIQYAIQAIESARKQTYKNIEIIVVDDGSTDGTWEALMAKYRRPTNVKLLHKSNGGTASALNLGIKVSQGDWIKWLSADDVLYPDAVATLLDHAVHHIDGQNCIFYTPYDYIDEKGVITGEFKEPDYNGMSKDVIDALLLDHFIGNGSSSLIHKSIFERAGFFDESLRVCDDYDFWLRACLKYGVRLWLVPVKTLQYRIHADQLTKKWGETAGPIIQEIRDRYARD